MRIAVISDIHGNLEALERVYDDIEQSDIDTIICLGDMVGYGPQPEEVVLSIREKSIPCTRGNHELAVIDDEELELFHENAYKAILRTRELLSDASIRFIKELPTTITKDHLLFVHGAPPDEISEYVSSMPTMRLIRAIKNMEQHIAFVGHTHELRLYLHDGKKLRQGDMPKGVIPLDESNKYIVNVGSVGQPRDGDNNAKYVIYDTDTMTIEARYVPYDIEKTVRLINERGFQQSSADRLW